MALLVSTTNAWTQARNRYIEDLNDEEKALYSTATLEDLYYEADAAEKLHRADSSRSYVSRIKPFIMAIEQYGSAFDVYANASSLILCPIWGSIRVIFHLTLEFGKYFEKLIEMFASIGDVLPRFRIYEKLFGNHVRLVESLAVVYLDIMRFCIEAKRILRRRRSSARIAFKLTWRTFDNQFSKQMDDFRNHQKNVEREASTSHMIEAANSRAVDKVNRLQIEKEKKEASRLKLLQKLSTIKYEEMQRKLRKLRHQETGQWLFKTTEFIDWKTSNESCCLRCHGIRITSNSYLWALSLDFYTNSWLELIAGSGKSVLTSNVIDTLYKYSSNQDTSIIYYYCDYAEQRTLETVNILGTVIKQLLRPIVISDEIERNLRKMYADDFIKPEATDLIDVFFAAIKHFSTVYLVLDGIDECDKQVLQEILGIINQFASSKTTAIKMFISCRENYHVLHALGSYDLIEVTPAALHNDIESFVNLTVRGKIDSGELKVGSSSLEQEIVHELVTKASGMFLWVSFQLDELCEAYSDAMIRDTLRDLPEGLIETYQRILNRISKHPRRIAMANKIFKWTTCARRPLLITEMKEAIAFDTNDTFWDIEKIPTDEHHIIGACGNLIILDDDESIRFAHHTVQQFLITDPTDLKYYMSTHPFYFDVSQANTWVGQICITYLSFSDFENQITKSAPNFRLRQSKEVESEGIGMIPKTVGIESRFVGATSWLKGRGSQWRSPNIDYSDALQIRPKKRLSQSLNEKYSLLGYITENWIWHTASFTEQTDYWENFKYLALEKKLEFPFRPWDLEVNRHLEELPYITLFEWAIKAGHEPCLRLLLKPPWGSKLHSYCEHEDLQQKNSTLAMALSDGNIKVLKLLLSVYKYEASNGRTLIEAVRRKQILVVATLLMERWSVDSLTENLTALHEATKIGHEAIVNLLLIHKADPNVPGPWANTPLHEAAELGYISIVNLLLNHGANPNMADTYGRTALHVATISGHDAVVQLLLANNARINAVTSGGLSALHCAAVNGHETTAQILISQHIDVDLENDRGRTALDTARKYRRSQLVQILAPVTKKKFQYFEDSD